MKSMWPPLVAIFFIAYFDRDGGGHGPLVPLGSATDLIIHATVVFFLNNPVSSSYLKMLRKSSPAVTYIPAVLFHFTLI